MALSIPVAKPIKGGIWRSPVHEDMTPVAISARMNGSDVIANAFATAILSLPPFHGLFLEDQTPARSRMIMKMSATIYS